MERKTKKNCDHSLTITVAEAAKILGISRAHAYAAARNKEIPTLRFGRRIVVPKAAFDEMLCAQNSAKTD